MRIPRLRIIFGAPRASKCPAGAELLQGRLIQRPHIKIAFSPPFMARDVPQSRAHQHKCGLAVRKIPDNSRPSSDFTVDPLQRVICADTAPVSRGKVVVREGFFGSSSHRAAAFSSLSCFSFSITILTFTLAASLSSWAWIAFSMADTFLNLETGTALRTFL